MTIDDLYFNQLLQIYPFATQCMGCTVIMLTHSIITASVRQSLVPLTPASQEWESILIYLSVSFSHFLPNYKTEHSVIWQHDLCEDALLRCIFTFIANYTYVHVFKYTRAISEIQNQSSCESAITYNAVSHPSVY